MTGSVGVIGLGRMAQALIFPLIEKGKLQSADVIGVVGSDASVARLTPALPDGLTLVTASDPRAMDAWKASVQLLAVKPQQLDAEDELSTLARLYLKRTIGGLALLVVLVALLVFFYGEEVHAITYWVVDTIGLGGIVLLMESN